MKKLKICPLLPSTFLKPHYATDGSGAFDIVAQQDFRISEIAITVRLGFKAVVPKGHLGVLAPRSGLGFRHGLELNNTVGLIDHDYRGEWKVCIRTKENFDAFQVLRGDRFIQCVIVPIKRVKMEIINAQEFDTYATARGAGGIGSTGR